MNQLLFERSTGNLSPDAFAKLQTHQLLRAFRPAPRFRFDGGERAVASHSGGQQQQQQRREQQQDILDATEARRLWAHQSGVNALALERFDGRILVSGGSDATIKIWDLEQCANPNDSHTYRPIAQIARAPSDRPISSRSAGSAQNPPATAGAHRFGITHLSFFPFDSDAFLSSSYDHTLKLWATDGPRLSGSFDLGSKVYTHAISPIASHVLVACGTQNPAVRLVDLRSGAAVHSLVAPGEVGGAAGAVLSVSWSPRHEHVLASGTIDGAVRIWDVRRSSGLVGLLDQEDSLGILHSGRAPEAEAVGAGSTGVAVLRGRGIRASAKAHTGPVNALAWTDDGNYIISAGHDRRIRVWDAATGANTLASFGPSIRNAQLATVPMFVSPTALTPAKKHVLFWPNESEILLLDLHDGTTIARLRGMGPSLAAVRARAGGERSIRNRVTGLVWRGAGGGGSSSGPVMGGRNAPGAVYSGHLDGQIRAWMPQGEGLDTEDEDSSAQEAVEEKAKKRKVIDDVFRSLMGKQITFT